jgi:hypothetical protein
MPGSSFTPSTSFDYVVGPVSGIHVTRGEIGRPLQNAAIERKNYTVLGLSLDKKVGGAEVGNMM